MATDARQAKRLYGDEYLMRSLTNEEKLRLQDGKAIHRGSKIYMLCRGCMTVIQVNKWLFGAWHSCD